MGDPKRTPFNMVEVVISLMIILIAMTSVLALLPKGVNSNSEAISRMAAADSADQLLSYLSVRASSDWEEELAAFPTSLRECASESNVVWSRNAAATAGEESEVLLPNTSILLEFNSPNEAAGYDPSQVGGLFRISQRNANTVIDFQAVARVWMELDVVHADPESLSQAERIAAATGAKLNTEISWPADLPYDQRMRATYSLTVARSVASGVPVATADPCVKNGNIAGTINLSPRNNSDFSFEMKTTSGGTITRDTIHSAGSSYVFSGTATYIRFCPKATGNSDSTFTVDGDAYTIENNKLYTVYGDAVAVRLWNDGNGNGKAMGKWYLTIGSSGGSIEGECGEELEISEAEEEEEETETFEIIGGVIQPQVPVNTTFDVLGCAITSSGTPCIVTASITIDKKTYEPFGDTGVKVTGSWRNRTVSAPGNINDGQPHSYDAGLLESGKDITVTAFSYRPTGSKIMEQGSESNQNCIVLRHGDAVPDIEGFQSQAGLETYIKGHINTEDNTVVLTSNQAILLFELGTTNLSSSAADFQDMVMVVTMTPEGK